MKYEIGRPEWVDPEKESDPKKQEIEEKLYQSILGLIETRKNFLGEGATAEVHFLEDNPNLCYKIIRSVDVLARADAVPSLPENYRKIYVEKKRREQTRRPGDASGDKPYHVDLLTEAELMGRTKDIEGNVRTPQAFAVLEVHGREEGEGYAVLDDMEILLMETLPAISVRDLIEKRELPPEGFDLQKFSADVKSFLKEMHENKHLYHRDLHDGNVMIDRVTGKPYIIDFGRSALASEEDAYKDELIAGQKTHFIRDEVLFREKVEHPLREYLGYRSQGPTKAPLFDFKPV